MGIPLPKNNIMRRYLCFFVFILSTWTTYAQQAVRGVVVDQALQSPVPYAQLLLQGPQWQRQTLSDSLGRFEFPAVPVGRYRLQASSLGYLPYLRQELEVTSGKQLVLQLPLQPSERQMDEVVIVAPVDKDQTLNSMAVGGARLLSVEEASRYAGGFDDPARLASSFAGVATGMGNNGMSVRGLPPRYMQWKLEGVEIPNPNHFAEVTALGGGGNTALSSQLLANSDFFLAAFPAEYNNALSGVLDLYMRKGNQQQREHTFQLGALGMDVASEGPVGKGSSYLFNYRLSTLTLLSPLLPPEAQGTSFQDLSFKWHTDLPKGGQLSVWGLGLLDVSGQEAVANPSEWRYARDAEWQDAKQYMGALGLTHRQPINSRQVLQTVLSVNTSGLDFRTDRRQGEERLPLGDVQNRYLNAVWRTTLQTRFGRRHLNKSGISLTRLGYDLQNQHAPLLGNPLQMLADEQGQAYLWSAFTTSSLQLHADWQLVLGLTAQRFSLNGASTLEPRLGLQWQMAPSHGFNLSYGAHSRLEPLNLYFSRDAQGVYQNRSLGFTKAHHLGLGYHWRIGEHLRLKAEPYWEYLYEVPVAPGTAFSVLNLERDAWYVNRKLTADGKARTAGLDLTLERFLHRGWYYLLTASLFDVQYMGGDGIWRGSAYNKQWVVNALGGREWYVGREKRNKLAASLRLTAQGGNLTTPVDYRASELAKEVVYDESRPYAERLFPQLFVHLTVSYRLNRPNCAHEFALKAMNVTAQTEFQEYRYHLQQQRVVPFAEALVLPNVMYRIDF